MVIGFLPCFRHLRQSHILRLRLTEPTKLRSRWRPVAPLPFYPANPQIQLIRMQVAQGIQPLPGTIRQAVLPCPLRSVQADHGPKQVRNHGTSDNLRHIYYTSHDDRRKALVAGWKQFQEDLQSFEPQAPARVLEGEVIQDTTTLMVRLNGSVIDSNLHLLEEQVFKRIDSIKSALVTDQDFADAESAVKFFKKTETKLKDGKETALAQVPDIAQLFTHIDHLTEAMASKRKSLDKQVKQQKQHIKDTIVLEAVTTLEKERRMQKP